LTVAALADPTRRAILARLEVLERAGLVARGRDAQRRPRRLQARPLAEANAGLEYYRDFWEANYERLDAVLTEMKQMGTGQKSPSRKERHR
jgi:DNA-binding transcriptional ArsR family regulator